jgi:ADP-heptose:LPS heptosyltransferase
MIKNSDLKILRYPKYKVIASKILEIIFAPLSLFSRRSKLPLKQKILLFDPFELGDAAMLSVMLDPLRKKFPEAKIHILIKPAFQVLYKNDPRVDKIHTFTMPWAKRRNKWPAFFKSLVPLCTFIYKLRKESFSIVIDARGDIRAQVFLVLLGCPVRVGCTQYVNSNISVWGLLLTNKTGFVPLLNKVQYNLHILKEGLGCNIDGYKLRLIYGGQISHNNVYRIVCHPGAGWVHRLWPEERWAQLVNKILLHYNVCITFVGGPGEGTLLQKIKDDVVDKIEFKLTTLDELLEIFSTSDLFIGLDSGPLHIATALGKKIIALFGPGNLTLWRPYSEIAEVVTHAEKFDCAPCVQDKCTSPANSCMQAITISDVYDAVERAVPVQFLKRF